jgi:hypothetical protein
MQRIVEFLKENIMAVVIIVILGIILIGFAIVRAGAEETVNDAGREMASVSRMKYSMYDNKIVTGEQVISAADKFKEIPEFSILIKTKANTTGFYAQNSDNVTYAEPTTGNTVGTRTANATNLVSVIQMKDTSNSTYYVNPSARFKAKIYYDTNEAVRLIVFTQM